MKIALSLIAACAIGALVGLFARALLLNLAATLK